MGELNRFSSGQASGLAPRCLPGLPPKPGLTRDCGRNRFRTCDHPLVRRYLPYKGERDIRSHQSRDLRKGLFGAVIAMIAAVPPSAGLCHFVRGYFAGASAASPDLWGFEQGGNGGYSGPPERGPGCPVPSAPQAGPSASPHRRADRHRLLLSGGGGGARGAAPGRAGGLAGPWQLRQDVHVQHHVVVHRDLRHGAAAPGGPGVGGSPPHFCERDIRPRDPSAHSALLIAIRLARVSRPSGRIAGVPGRSPRTTA
jgi:hypothetical protein